MKGISVILTINAPKWRQSVVTRYEKTYQRGNNVVVKKIISRVKSFQILLCFVEKKNKVKKANIYMWA